MAAGGNPETTTAQMNNKMAPAPQQKSVRYNSDKHTKRGGAVILLHRPLIEAEGEALFAIPQYLRTESLLVNSSVLRGIIHIGLSAIMIMRSRDRITCVIALGIRNRCNSERHTCGAIVRLTVYRLAGS